MDTPFVNSLRENTAPAPYFFVAEIAQAFAGKALKTDTRIATLEGRLAALETRRLMSFEGAHDPAREYKAGSVVLRSGGVFVAMVATDEPPGSSSLWRQIGAAK